MSRIDEMMERIRAATRAEDLPPESHRKRWGVTLDPSGTAVALFASPSEVAEGTKGGAIGILMEVPDEETARGLAAFMSRPGTAEAINANPHVARSAAKLTVARLVTAVGLFEQERDAPAG